ncbi:cytosolic phospholipase A2 gamma-like [Pholidichthys leucotaenia]
MQTGFTGLPAVALCLSFVVSALLSEEVNKMEGRAAASEKVIRQSHSLSAGELEYVLKRKQIVQESLSSLDINCTVDSVPNIALLGSGGGQRAAVALVGSLYQLGKEGVLDTLLYVGGVSGSTWSMASLYSDPEWSTNMDRAVSRLLGPAEFTLQQVYDWLAERAKDEDFSLTDIWGVLTSAGYMKQMDTRYLSHEASRNATNPYPIYGAIENFCFSSGPTEGKWFEISPHEAGFTELGFYVEMSLLGSKFTNGELLERKPEMDMVKLQGILGCALAHEEIIREYIPAWMNDPEIMDAAALELLRVYKVLHSLISLIRGTVADATALANIDELQKILEDKASQNKSALVNSKSLEERKSLFNECSLELLSAVETWSQSLEDGEFKTHVSFLVNKVIPLIIKWEWGTTGNILYQLQDPAVPACLFSRENFQLLDAGLLINVGYPSFLGAKRDIDLIIAPEYSAGLMFETLTLARNYAAEVKKLFPEIDDKILEERDWPKDCYVFEGNDNVPTIVFMPLFNRQNCKDAEEWRAKMEEFSTFQHPFSQEKMEFVLETAKANVRNNRQSLLREIKEAALRRQAKQQREAQRGRRQRDPSQPCPRSSVCGGQ